MIMMTCSSFLFAVGILFMTQGECVSADSTVPTIIIGVDVNGNDVKMPLLGAGTWQYNDTVAYQSVCKAFQVGSGQYGYTLVDTAFGYGNQVGVGKAIRDCWNGKREDLFVLTKIPGGLTADEVHATHTQNLLQLGLEYVDHVMTHFPSDWQQKHASPALRQQEWLALEDLYYAGLTRSIGISHYCPQHIQDILKVATVKPSLNQVEYHVGSGDIDQVMNTCATEGISFMSFSPLCGPCEYDPEDSLITGALVTEIGAKYNKTGSQVSLKFVVQQGYAAIPKSNNEAHIQSNLDIFDFELSDSDMKRLTDAAKPAAEAGDCDVP